MQLTVIMYHYVRHLAESRYPLLKGLERHLFIEQIQYIKHCYTPVTGYQVVEAIQGKKELPRNAALLTFDDGYLDHFTTVLPILNREKMSGIFFPSVSSSVNGQILDVNKIHFILATTSDSDRASIVRLIDATVHDTQLEFGLQPIRFYKDKYAIATSFDTSEIMYIKRMLQFGLPKELRSRLVSQLFTRCVSIDEPAFSHELYMNEDQLKCLVDAGMMVGNHGDSHDWLDVQDPKDQAREIDSGLDLVERVAGSRTDWVMCYPHGGWNESLLGILRERQCAMGFTIQPGLADLSMNDPLLLPRIDTNDLLKMGQESNNYSMS